MKRRAFAAAICCSALIVNACDDGNSDDPPQDPPPAGAPTCQEACGIDDDCLIGFECLSSRCVSTAASTECATDDECRALFSGWLAGCTENANCYGGTGVCITVGSANYCTFEKGATCPTGVEVVVDLAQGGTISVCGNATAQCAEMAGAKVCLDPECALDTDCTGNGTRCYDALYCGCKDDSECDFVRDGGSRCLQNGTCGCAQAAECGAPDADICKDGQCGCSSTAACNENAVHPSTAWVCER